MFTFRRLALVVVIAGLASGCERQSMASTEVDADRQATAVTQGPGTSTNEATDPLRPVFGTGDAGFVAKFLSPQTIGNSAIFERDGKFVTIGGTGNTCCSLQVDGGFSAGAPIVNIQQLDPSGDVNLDFAQAGFGRLGDVGVIRTNGPERFAILSRGRNPRGLSLSLAEDGGNVGIGNVEPHQKLSVVGDVAFFGTGHTCCVLQVQNDFPAGGTMVNLVQLNPTGANVLEFAQGGFGVLGDVGIARAGGPERFVILSSGRNPRKLPLALVEGDGNVGIGTPDPQTKLDVVGNTSINGNLTVTGTKSSIATLSDGRRVLLYAVESPKNWFEDFGTARLQHGEAWVSLERVFGETVNTGGTYHVFLTPNGDCKGLYVAERRADGFVVRELGGGRSTVSFDYRVVAPRRGFETVRLSELP